IEHSESRRYTEKQARICLCSCCSVRFPAGRWRREFFGFTSWHARSPGFAISAGYVMTSTTTSCLICNAPLSFHQVRTDKLCSSLACRWKYSSLPKSQLCASCGRPLSLQQIATQYCDAPECRRAFVDEQARERVREQERDRQRVEAQKV